MSKEKLPIPKWTVGKVQREAERRGKTFQPPAEVQQRLAVDLAKGATVLFDEIGVKLAVKRGIIPAEWEKDLCTLVKEKNDTAIIPSDAIEAWRTQQMASRVLTRRRP